MEIDELKFPIGAYTANRNPNENLLQQWIEDIESFPSRVERLTKETYIEKLN